MLICIETIKDVETTSIFFFPAIKNDHVIMEKYISLFFLLPWQGGMWGERLVLI